jgi:tetratricopeptide (TPR) repeat protein
MKPRHARFFLAILLSVVWTAHPSTELQAQEACDALGARVVSVQGSVQFQRAGTTEWVPAKFNDAYCPGDVLRVGGQSRAVVLLPNENLLRLDENTTITFSGVEKESTSLLELLKGAVHFFSRMPRVLKVSTPFVNGAVEGTEFFIRVEGDRALLSVFEGRVRVSNPWGSLVLARGQAAVAESGKAPLLRVVAHPRDAVQWALYYPPVLYVPRGALQGGDGWQDRVRQSVHFSMQGDVRKAFESIERVSEDVRSPRFFAYRASLLLAVGRVEEAERDIGRALRLNPQYGEAYALQSIMAVVQNDKDKARRLAEKAVESDPESAAAWIALSYARQSSFDLEGARASLLEAVRVEPKNALAWARLAEIRLSFGDLDQALDAARQASALEPDISRTQTVLGFAYLTQVKTKESKQAFEKAVQLDQANSLARLGLGLAKIREGDLDEGGEDIQVAASLDPNNALVRSYLGKVYFEQKRTPLDEREYAIAKELDPQDPTPWFYDAITKQTTNRPVEALQDLQKSIELNDHRAVYRSRLLLDEDLAARSAGLGRIYRDLGFEQLGLVEGWKSVGTDPANYSAHRFLADSYSALPRHEVARVSELLQSQLLQPINITPIQPQLTESSPFILEGSGPTALAFNEFNPLFTRNRLALQASGVVGENDTWGDDVVHSAVLGKWSYSLGQFHYETDGFRNNNDQDRDLYNAFAQVALSHKTSLQAEYRYQDVEKGDLSLRFDPENFTQSLRQEEIIRTTRFGFRHAFSPGSELVGNIFFQNADAESGLQGSFSATLPAPLPPLVVQAQQDTEIDLEEEGIMAEIQHHLRAERVRFVTGAGRFSGDLKEKMRTTILYPLPFPPFSLSATIPSTTESGIRHTNLYAYSLIDFPEAFTWTFGASADFFDGIVDENQFNPKFGVMWHPASGTTVRGALFKVLKRTLISSQTLEPTQVAGFNQFFDDPGGTDSWRYGLGLDQRISNRLFGGIEGSRRELEVPYTLISGTATRNVGIADWEEKVARAYLYWTPHPWLTLSGEYQYERFDRDPQQVGTEQFTEVRTHRLSPGVRFFHPSGFSAGLRASYLDQKGVFGNPRAGTSAPGEDDFWVVDASIGYRFPKRYGVLQFEVKNLFDEEFRFQDTDPAHPSVYPERQLFLKLTVAF